MTLKVKIIGVLFVSFVFHRASGIQELCKSLCTKELGRETGKEARSKILFEACSVGCRMGRLDALIAWPATVNGENCLQSCEDAFTHQDDEWACCIGCNATLTLNTGSDDSLFEEESTTSAPSSYSSFFSFLYHAFFPSFFSFTNGNSMEIAIVTVDGDLGSSAGNDSERSYIYIVGSNADSPVSIDNTEQVAVPQQNPYRLDTDWSDWGDNDDGAESNSTDCHELWFTLQIISVALIVISFIFCCFNTQSDKEHQREREIVNCKEQPTNDNTKLSPHFTKI